MTDDGRIPYKSPTYVSEANVSQGRKGLQTISGKLLGQMKDRTHVEIRNDTNPGTVYLGFGTAAQIGSGVTLYGRETWKMPEATKWYGSIMACSPGTCYVNYTEW